MATILVLGHYCESHGPTAICCTEGLPVGCATCFEDESTMSMRRPSSSRSLNPADGLAGIARISRTKSNSSDAQSGSFANSQTPSGSAVETPPESPRVVALQGQQSSGLRRDSSFRKTYDENDKKSAVPCENCALTLPKQTKDGPATNKLDGNGPVLRTRKPYERINVPSPPKTDSSNSSNSSDSEHAISNKPSHRRQRSRTLIRVGTSSSDSSTFSSNSHDHYLDYTSTHEPLAPASFSLVRQSCLRTLSCETLPPSSTQSASTPSSPFINNSFSSASMPNSATSTSGGPIFFGDPQAGYTTAYIFRIPDPNARGRRRVYALMALSTHRERAAMQSFSFLSDAFRKTAAWIQGLAEAELERTEAANSPRLSNSDERSGNSSNNTPTSAFLSGRNRGPDGKFAGMSLRARGLAELVGMPDFFFELHKLFVKLLVEMNVTLGL